MDQASEKLEPVDSIILTEEKWEGSDKIEDEVAKDVASGYLNELLLSSGFFDEIEYDLDQVDDVDEVLNLNEGLLSLVLWTVTVSFDIIIHIDILEHKHIWSDKQAVDDQASYHEVPHLTECLVRVH